MDVTSKSNAPAARGSELPRTSGSPSGRDSRPSEGIAHRAAGRPRAAPVATAAAAAEVVLPPVSLVILATPGATTLWPLARTMQPDALTPLAAIGGQSLLGALLRRIGGVATFATVTVVGASEHRFLFKDELDRAGCAAARIFLVPPGVGATAAFALAALRIERERPRDVVAVLDGRNVIGDEARFSAQIDRAARLAASGRIVICGDQGESYPAPRRKARGRAAPAPGRPAGEAAPMIVAPAALLAREIGLQAPGLAVAARTAVAAAEDDLGCLRFGAVAALEQPLGVSAEGLVRGSPAATAISGDTGLAQVTSWGDLMSSVVADDSGNRFLGDVVSEGATDTIVISETGLVVTLGVRNLAIVDTPDALLVADMSRAGSAMQLLAKVQKSRRKELDQHVRSHRPWGYFEQLSMGGRFQVKLLHVKPGAKLSLQMHYHRSEHWVVVQGTAKVTVGETSRLVRENESVYIRGTEWHRLENPGKVPLEVIEVQIGSYLGEDDIVRSDDVYRRAHDETR